MARSFDTSTDRYIEQVRKIPVLDRETETALARRARKGDEAASEALIRANLRYVVAVALQYRRYGIRVADLIAEGNVGLMTAVSKFDPERGVRFVTYAGYWIRAFVLEAVVRSASLVGGGAGALRSKVYFRLRRERARVATLTDDRDERLQMLAERFDTTPERVEKMLQRIEGSDVSLDVPLFDDGGATLADTMVSEWDAADEQVDGQRRAAALGTQVKQALEVLDQRERYIVEQRMLADDGKSLAAIGRDLGVSRERARQLEARAKAKLRKQLGAFAPAA